MVRANKMVGRHDHGGRRGSLARRALRTSRPRHVECACL